MTLKPEQAMRLDSLINELMKDRPNNEKVKNEMSALGLKYSEDPLERLNTVLVALHPKVQTNKKAKDLDI